MTIFDHLKNLVVNRGRYKSHPEAVIIACFFNPQNSPYRLLAFHKWYRSIKHLNHRIIECLIGEQTKSQLPKSKFITQVSSSSLLWHKEGLLNNLVRQLPERYKYIFWLDTDVLFTNHNWMVESAKNLEWFSILQPFEYCVHLNRNEIKPDFDVDAHKAGLIATPFQRHERLWRSFSANYHTTNLSDNINYDRHGHVGFAWGARREVLEMCPLYDKGLIGGADHIIAHAAAGHIPHNCITNAFKDDIDNVIAWSKKFYSVTQGAVGYTEGDLYHIWHGDIAAKQYLKRAKDFTVTSKKITKKDKNGLYRAGGNNAYIKNYYRQREVWPDCYDFGGLDTGFLEDMGYAIYDIVNLFGQPYLQNLDSYQQADDVDVGFEAQDGVSVAVDDASFLQSINAQLDEQPIDVPLADEVTNDVSESSDISDNFS